LTNAGNVLETIARIIFGFYAVYAFIGKKFSLEKRGRQKQKILI